MLQARALDSLKALLPQSQVFLDWAALLSYEGDAGLDRGRPEAVVFPRTAEEVVRIVRWAAEPQAPLIARGAGTGISGGAVADRGGVIVAFSKMNQILEIDAEGRSALVEPAVINLTLDEQVKAQGLYFPPDPASQRASTIGGNVAENSGGPHCFKYGVTTNYVIGLEAILSNGQRIQVGGPALDYPGYDLCGLLTGSEGTLALITKVFARLIHNPPAVKTLLAVFDSVEQAGTAVSAIIAAGLVPAAMEMIDQKIIKIIEAYAHAGLPEDAGALIILEVDGYRESLDAQINEAAQLLQAHGGRNLRIAQSEEERASIWLARKSAAGAVARLAPAYYTVDITVPRSRLAEMLTEVNHICDHYDLQTGHVFHAGDGNLHPLVLLPDPSDPDLIERVHRASEEMIRRCVAMNGSITGEHGVGIEKRQYMPLMHTSAELMAMWDIKQVFDPPGLLNPGKVFPPATDSTIPFAGYTASFSPNMQITLPAIRNNCWEPASVEEASLGLATLSKAGQPVHISGAARPPSRKPTHAARKRFTASAAQANAPEEQHQPILLSTAALSGITTYAPDDLYLTAGAGTKLSDIQAFLAQDHKQVMLASPSPEATIGGLVAANLNAPIRIRYGSIRDVVLCATAVLPDGRLIRTGRPLVKNVAGYDLTKIFIGSYGTLGLLTDITLKISAQPRARRTLLIPVDDLRAGLPWARQACALALIASAVILCKGCERPELPSALYWLAYTAEGLPEEVEAELRQVRQKLQLTGGPAALETETLSGTDLWAELLGSAPEHALQVRIGIPAKDIITYLEAQAALLNKGTFIADIPSGIIYSIAAGSLSKNLGEAQAWIEALRQPALATGGYAFVTSLPESWRGVIDRWGYRPDGWEIMRALKARWDPQSILNPGLLL